MLEDVLFDKFCPNFIGFSEVFCFLRFFILMIVIDIIFSQKWVGIRDSQDA